MFNKPARVLVPITCIDLFIDDFDETVICSNTLFIPIYKMAPTFILQGNMVRIFIR